MKRSASEPGLSHLFHCSDKETKHGRFLFDQKFRQIFDAGTNGAEMSRERLQKIPKLFNFRKANHSTENYGNSWIKFKWNGNFQEKLFQKFGYTLGSCHLFPKLCNAPISVKPEEGGGGGGVPDPPPSGLTLIGV